MNVIEEFEGPEYPVENANILLLKCCVIIHRQWANTRITLELTLTCDGGGGGMEAQETEAPL
jgi:hypothetical protein